MFQQIQRFIDQALGLGLENKDINVGQMSLRALVVFVLAIAMIRIGNKRFMGKNAALDVLLGIVFGSMVSRAITGNSPFLPTLVASLVLVLLHWVMSAIAFRSQWFGTLVKGHDSTLVRDGEIQWEAMKAAHLTRHDLHEAIRSSGAPPDIGEVASAHLERNGDISVIKRESD
ncbi:MAG TPA: YetF domain-containing protein [Pyrinomonadaceae bacterium]|nr:YetF domain-containing protein [Pyrinomonadaceae bacterium]